MCNILHGRCQQLVIFNETFGKTKGLYFGADSGYKRRNHKGLHRVSWMVSSVAIRHNRKIM